MTEPVPHTPPTPDAERIALGLNVDWVYETDHPRHGKLTFRAQLPKAERLLLHSILLDERLAPMGDVSIARQDTLIVAAALAGLHPVNAADKAEGCLLRLPIVGEERVEHDGGAKLTVTYYDAASETDLGFLVDVWLNFSAWRRAKLQEVDAVKGSSGEPQADGSESSSPSVVPMDSPSTIPA